MAITFMTNEDKAELLSKINEAASSGDGLEREIVDVLPTTGIKVDTVYLVPNAESETNDQYDEYIFIPNEGTTATEDGIYSSVDGVWEAFGGGSGDVDLTEINNRIDELSEAIADKANKAGWTPDKYIGTDADGNLVEKDAPAGGGTGTVTSVNGNKPDENGNVTVEMGQPTDEQVQMAVESYLEENPIESGTAVNGDFVALLTTILSQVSFYDSDQSQNIAALLNYASAGGSGDEIRYSVTINLTDVQINNTQSSIIAGLSYVASLSTNLDGHEVGNVKIMMGGNDITSSSYFDGVVNIANVTGDIVITAEAVRIGAVFTLAAPISETTGTASVANVVDTGIILFDEDADRTILFAAEFDSELADISGGEGYYNYLIANNAGSLNNDHNGGNNVRIFYNGTTNGLRILHRDSGGINTFIHIPPFTSLVGLGIRLAIIYHAATRTFEYKAVTVDGSGTHSSVYTASKDLSGWEFVPDTQTMILGAKSSNPFVAGLRHTSISECEIYKIALDDAVVTEWLNK